VRILWAECSNRAGSAECDVSSRPLSPPCSFDSISAWSLWFLAGALSRSTSVRPRVRPESGGGVMASAAVLLPGSPDRTSSPPIQYTRGRLLQDKFLAEERVDFSACLSCPPQNLIFFAGLSALQRVENRQPAVFLCLLRLRLFHYVILLVRSTYYTCVLPWRK
jgi:hypothetical protein